MLVRTYLKRHPDVKEFWLMSDTVFSLCRTDDFDTMNCFGDRKITRVEEAEGELVTLHIRCRKYSGYKMKYKLEEPTMDDIRELAISGARKICGFGTCHHGYDCGNSWNTRRFPLHGPETICPLAKYKVEHDDDPRPFYLRPSSECFATRNELFALCCECEHATLAKGAAQPTVVRIDLNICCDCPVKSTEECIDEMEAES